ncbi:MAG: tetratricopeptide repeat protein [Gammaproteobacteria bacterium]
MAEAGDSIDALRRLLDGEEVEAAAAMADRLLAARPDSIEVLTLAAVAARRSRDWSRAIELDRRVVALHPHSAPLLANLAADLLQTGQADEAATVLERIPPGDRNGPMVMMQLSRLQYQRQDYDGACDTLLALTRAHRDYYAAHLELAHALLMRGKWRAGWLEYEARYHLPQTRGLAPPLRSPQWNGQPLDGRVVLVADQGYGDSLQFCRYIPLVARKVGEVVLMRSAPLARLLDTVPGVAAGYERWEALPPHHAHSTLSGLPRVFETRPDTIPPCEDLLGVDDDAVERWRQRLTGTGDARLRVGVAWSGRTEFRDNRLRAMRAAELSPLGSVPGVELVSLQVGPPAAEHTDLDIVDCAADFGDFADTAACIRALDLVVTTDTAVAHLAGTLGCPTWVLLAHAPDWRWGPAGAHCGWYTSVRLFRQHRAGDWHGVVEDARTALLEAAASDDPREALEALTRSRHAVGLAGAGEASHAVLPGRHGAAQ